MFLGTERRRKEKFSSTDKTEEFEVVPPQIDAKDLNMKACLVSTSPCPNFTSQHLTFVLLGPVATSDQDFSSKRLRHP